MYGQLIVPEWFWARVECFVLFGKECCCFGKRMEWNQGKTKSDERHLSACAFNLEINKYPYNFELEPRAIPS